MLIIIRHLRSVFWSQLLLLLLLMVKLDKDKIITIYQSPVEAINKTFGTIHRKRELNGPSLVMLPVIISTNAGPFHSKAKRTGHLKLVFRCCGRIKSLSWFMPWDGPKSNAINTLCQSLREEDERWWTRDWPMSIMKILLLLLRVSRSLIPEKKKNSLWSFPIACGSGNRNLKVVWWKEIEDVLWTRRGGDPKWSEFKSQFWTQVDTTQHSEITAITTFNHFEGITEINLTWQLKLEEKTKKKNKTHLLPIKRLQ